MYCFVCALNKLCSVITCIYMAQVLKLQAAIKHGEDDFVNARVSSVEIWKVCLPCSVVIGSIFCFVSP